MALRLKTKAAVRLREKLREKLTRRKYISRELTNLPESLQLRKTTTARPMTHDLILKIIKGLGAEATKIVVTELKENTFYAIIHINTKKGEIETDSRPSDAIALALRVGTPIYVDEEVINRAGRAEEAASEVKKDDFTDWLEKLDPDDFKYKM